MKHQLVRLGHSAEKRGAPIGYHTPGTWVPIVDLAISMAELDGTSAADLLAAAWEVHTAPAAIETSRMVDAVGAAAMYLGRALGLLQTTTAQYALMAQALTEGVEGG